MSKELKPWCECQIIGDDDIGGTGMQLLCTAHLGEGVCIVCPYTPKDIKPDGTICNGRGYKDEDFKPVQKPTASPELNLLTAKEEYNHGS